MFTLFNNVSWTQFFLVVGILTTAYYAVLFFYFRKKGLEKIQNEMAAFSPPQTIHESIYGKVANATIRAEDSNEKTQKANDNKI